ncbi:MAG TPA: alpha-glucan family phosphorylase [Candidatus Dormibacteraeota bacterium]
MLEELHSWALDLTWTWQPRIQAAFRALDPEAWEDSGHNPLVLLDRLGAAGVDAALARSEVKAAVEGARTALHDYRDRRPPFYDAQAPLLIGYFSLEFGLAECLPIYAGGLGILAGDHLKAASDLGLPLVGMGLLYRHGYGRQRIDAEGRQTEVYSESRPELLPVQQVMNGDQPLLVEAPLGGETVKAAVWRVQVGRVPLFLLDTDVPENTPEQRLITDRLYVADPESRLRQEIVLGIGGVRALRALGIEATVFHLNEGHSFLAGIERIRELRGSRQLTLEEARLVARAGIVFTTHTPVAAGSDFFSPELVRDLLGPYLKQTGITFERFMELGREKPADQTSPLTSTYVCLRLADHAVGVSRLHGTVSRRLWKPAWPGLQESQVPIGFVTNGVHTPTWVAPEVADLLSRHVSPDWWDLAPSDPRWEQLSKASDEELWSIHTSLKQRLVDFVRERTGAGLDPEALIIGFSRRFAPYKRATLLLADPKRLHRMLGTDGRRVHFVYAGKAHPADTPGKELVQRVVTLAREEPGIVFVEDYDIEVARHVVQGSDVWLNNPRRFLEASGTSGMKAGANGALNVSILDGWWDEAYQPAIGWAIPSGATLDRPDADDRAEAEGLYRLLEREVVPAYFDRPDGLPRRWLGMMRASLRTVGTDFAARRMVLDYFDRCYGPAARRVEQMRLLPDWGG